MSEGRSFTELTEEDIKKLEKAYTSDPRPLKEICKDLNIKYTVYTNIRETRFPEAVRCPQAAAYRKKERLKRLGLTHKDVITIKNKYIRTTIPTKVIMQEFALTPEQFSRLHKEYFPEWRRHQGTRKAYKIEPGEAKEKTEGDLIWLRRHWNWKPPQEQKATTRKKRTGESKYRIVHAGDRAIRTRYRPDGRFH